MPLRLSLLKRRTAPDQTAASPDPGLAEDEAARGFDRSRRPLRVAAIVLVAMAAGQIVQSTNQSGGASAATTSSRKTSPALPRPQINAVFLTSASAKITAGASDHAQPPVVTIAATPEVMALPATPQVAAEPACQDKLDMSVLRSALLGLSLVAPCHPEERVVLRHAGLTITGRTNAAGTLSVTLPALDQAGAVQVRFADGSVLDAAKAVPELASLRRFALQWHAKDSFILHGLEGGAELNAVGDIHAGHPGQIPFGGPSPGGYLVELGDAGVTNALLAQVYTFPANPTRTADVAIEVPVTPQTCGHEMLGQTITSAGGSASLTDLTMSMPDCGTEVGYLLLKNLPVDMKIAASN